MTWLIVLRDGHGSEHPVMVQANSLVHANSLGEAAEAATNGRFTYHYDAYLLEEK